MTARGIPVSTQGLDQDTLRKALANLGDANVQARGLGLGRLVDGGDAGKLDAHYAQLATSAAAGNVYQVPHTLGRIPGFAMLYHSENDQTPISHYSLIGWRRENWTTSSVEVRVVALVGSLDGGILTLMIGGER